MDPDSESMCSDTFSSSDISGFEDGIYPPRMDMIWDDFPEEFLEKFGEKAQGFMDDPWWQFPMEKFEEMKAFLSQHGFSVEKVD